MAKKKIKSRIKIGGKTMLRASCHDTKTDAKRKAEGIRKSGNLARVRKNGKRWCVYKGSKRRKAVKS